MLDFPNSPNVGDTFGGPGGVLWRWDGVKWTPTGAGTLAPINSPVFTGDPQAPTPAYGDNDQSIPTTSFVQSAVGPALHDVGRNLLHNPLFNIQQRGAGGFAATGLTADRWWMVRTNSTCTTSIIAMTDSDRATIGDEAATSILLSTVTGTSGTTDVVLINQSIENVRRLGSKTVIVSFWAEANAALKLGASIDQNFGTGGSPSAVASGNGQSVTLTTSWVRYALTFILPSTAGKTLGTNNDHKTTLNLWLTAGSGYATGSGGVPVQSGTINLWGVQLEIAAPGQTAPTPLEKPDPRYDLANCQRFYCAYAPAHALINAAAAGAYLVATVNFPVAMRANPTITFQSALVAPTNCANPTGDTSSTLGFRALSQATAAGIAGFDSVFTASADL